MGNTISCGAKESYSQPTSYEENDPLRNGIGAAAADTLQSDDDDTPADGGHGLVEDDLSSKGIEEVRSEGGSLLPRPDVDDTPPEAKFMASDTEETLRLRARYEAEFVRKFDTVRLPPGDIYYIVSTKWIDSWKRFISEEKELPGPISNNLLFHDDLKTLLPRFVRSKDYRGINQRIWSFWLARYGGGPLITRFTLDIYDHTGESPCRDLNRVLDPGTIVPTSVASTSPAAIDITTKPVGIKNLGSTCFVTCVLQCMLSIAEFTCLASQMKRGVKHYQQKHHRNHHHHHHDDDVDKQQQQQNTAHNTVKEKKENAPSNVAVPTSSPSSSSSSSVGDSSSESTTAALYEPQHGYYEVAAAMVDLFSKC
ncbi:hypothetical protein Pmar_PMAR012093, partial [Perkinsus marinus ATCC 50983]